MPGAVVATIWRSNPAPKSPPLSILVASISPHAARPWICALPAFAASSTATTFRRGAPGDRHAVAGAGAGRTVRPLRHRTGGHLRRAMPGHHRPARRSATPPHQRNARRRLAGHADRHHHRAGVHAPRADLAGGHRPVLRLFHVHRLRQARRPDRLRRPAAHDADHAFAAGTRPGPGPCRRDAGWRAVLRGVQPGFRACSGCARNSRPCRWRCSPPPTTWPRARLLRRDRGPGRRLSRADPEPVHHDGKTPGGARHGAARPAARQGPGRPPARDDLEHVRGHAPAAGHAGGHAPTTPRCGARWPATTA